MEISIKTNVAEQVAKGYAEFYARHLQKGYYMWIIITNPLPVLAFPFYYHILFPDVTMGVLKSIFIYSMLAVVMAAMGAVEYLGYKKTMSNTMKRMRTFYERHGIFGELLIQIRDEELLIKSENRIWKNYHYHGRWFLRGAGCVRKVYECPDVLYFLAGSCYYVIPVWDCDPEEWPQLCAFLKKAFGKRYICLKKPVFPNRSDKNRQ